MKLASDGEDIREEFRTRVNQRFYGHFPEEKEEGSREVKVKALYLVLAGFGCPGCPSRAREKS